MGLCEESGLRLTYLLSCVTATRICGSPPSIKCLHDCIRRSLPARPVLVNPPKAGKPQAGFAAGKAEDQNTTYDPNYQGLAFFRIGVYAWLIFLPPFPSTLYSRSPSFNKINSRFYITQLRCWENRS